jgi:hypothetical protein
MKYIDKKIAKFKDHAYHILETFIQGQWRQDANQYVNLTYEDFRNEEFRDLLLKEQDYFCCYCMKRILKDETTLEHIIPNKSKDSSEIHNYTPYGELKHNVRFWESKMRYEKLKLPPFPHILAYENIVASCNGFIPDSGFSKCCNNARGNKEIVPLFYISTIRKEIQYDLSGLIICNENYNDTIENLKLEHPTLQLFRRCWLNLPSKYSALDVIDASVDEKLRDNIIDDMDVTRIKISDRTTIKNPVYWNSFMNYFWFYLYKTEEGL